MIVLLLGPTATGKTDLATSLAEQLPCHLISMDATQVYRGLDIGSAKPSPALRAQHPHALVDIRDPAERYSAAEFLADADREAQKALAAEKLPVLVGGSMLYARAFRDGLARLPAASPAVRASIEDQAQQFGWEQLHARLAEVDPDAAARIHPRNSIRIQRALEVWQTSGKPISAWWAKDSGKPAAERLGADLVEFALMPRDRAALHQRIETRFDAMLAAGFRDEVLALRRRGDLHDGLPAIRSVGYRQMWHHLARDYGTEVMRSKALAATRQLARRQLTWLRRWPWACKLTANRTEDRIRAILERLGA